MSEENNNPQAGQTDQANGPEIGIQRMYLKDTSFEAPNSPKIFLGEWQPEMNIDLGTKTSPLEDGVHEVILTVTVTVKVKEEVAFLCEVHYAGIFTISGFPEDQIKAILGSYCPNILYPYVRTIITGMVVDGGFPQLYLAPVNFDALYQQHLEQQSGEAPAAAPADDDKTKH